VYAAANYSTENTVPSLIALDKLRDSFLRMRIRVNQHVLNTDEKKMADIDTSIIEMRTNVDKALQQYATLLSDAKDKEILLREQESWKKIQPQIDAVLAESRTNHNDKARLL
ncbi:MAG: MCP four helix bundle domain-containing protein, partial [Rhodospirillaceae bacterium]|nr:MCP four helix bundle domain-containing protein [Rhodospirillaceae bacterium]